MGRATLRLLPSLAPFGRLGSQRGLDGLFESGRTWIAELGLRSGGSFQSSDDRVSAANAADDNFSRAMGRKPRNHSNVSQPDSSTCKAFARHPQSLAAPCRRSMEGVSYASRCFPAHRCLLHRCCRGQCNWSCYAAVSGCTFGPEAQHHRPHQAAVASSSEAGRELHDHLSVDRRSAILRHSLHLT
jgi:hypothetical protein